MAIERFDFNPHDGEVGMEASPDGEYVRFEDHQRLLTSAGIGYDSESHSDAAAIETKVDLDGNVWPKSWNFSMEDGDNLIAEVAVREWTRHWAPYVLDRTNRKTFGAIKSMVARAIAESKAEFIAQMAGDNPTVGPISSSEDNPQ